MHFLTFPHGSRSISPLFPPDTTFYSPERHVVSKRYYKTAAQVGLMQAIEPSSQLKVAAYFPVDQVDTRTNCGAA